MHIRKTINKFNKYIISIIIISLCGELYFYPFQGEFRFSAGVLAIGFILLLFDEISEIYLAFLAGLSVLGLRIFIDSFSEFNSILDLIIINSPGALYYTFYGVLFYLFRIRKYRRQPIKVISLLTIIDVSSNILEVLIRNDQYQVLFRYLLFIGILRSLIIYMIYFVFKNQEILIMEKEYHRRYNQFNTLISNIQSEIFYLTKSTYDIENVMSKSYKLYENTKDNKEINHLALDVAREIHEIKKDYYRVLNGFKSYADNFDFNNSMDLKEIASIIKSNLTRYIEFEDKDIQVTIEFLDNIKVKNYYYLFTIINNLIINAIDSITDSGIIKIEGRKEGKNYVFKVIDNGAGIEEDLIPYIFNPGFTTKYDLETGNPSTGIGLAHVKYIIESLKGTVHVDSKINIGTTFTIEIPIENLRDKSWTIHL